MSDIGIDGDSNRAAGRDYIEINLASQEREREPLALSQRKRLNEEVAQISDELAMDPRELWRTVHESTGVKGIGEIKKDQFQDAMNALQAVRDRQQEQARAQTLINELQQASSEKSMGRQLARYCLREFGEQALTKLSIRQLTRALKYVDEYQVQATVPLSWYGFRAVVLRHPWHFTAVFVLGSVFGGVFY